MHCFGGQPLVSVLFMAVLITLFLLNSFSLLVIIFLIRKVHVYVCLCVSSGE